MTENERRVHDLADFTDALLGGKVPGAVTEMMTQEERVVRVLHDIVAPNESIDPLFREALNRRLNEEWNLVFQKKTHSQARYRRWYYPLAVSAAALVLIISAIVFVVMGGNIEGESTAGTAQGSTITVILISIIGLTAGIVLYFWNRRR